MKNIILIIVLLISCQFSWAQQELNSYKYVIVPKNFDFQDSNDSYQINSLIKFLLDKKGFTTIFDDEIAPKDLLSNQCLALKINLLEESNFTRTKVKIAFINCQNKTVYTSKDGISKLKDYKKLYHEAIRNTFKTFDNFQYNYTPIKEELVINEAPLVKEVIKKIDKQTPKPTVIVKEDKKVQVVKNEIENIKNKDSLIGLYNSAESVYEISIFQNYYIFSKRIVDGNSFKTAPLGFIYKTSKNGNYLVKTTDTFTGYLIEGGIFIIDEIGADGVVKSTTYTKVNN